jgi:hypothetical protein
LDSALQALDCFVKAPYDADQMKPFSSGNFSVIKSREDLKSASDFLKTQKVISVDIENHKATSYDGFICLVQITAGFDTD